MQLEVSRNLSHRETLGQIFRRLDPPTSTSDTQNYVTTPTADQVGGSESLEAETFSPFCVRVAAAAAAASL